MAIVRPLSIILLSVSLAAVSGYLARAAAIERTNPMVASQLAALNGFAKEKVAARTAMSELAENEGKISAAVKPSIAESAKDAFRLEPTAADAVAAYAHASDDMNVDDRRALLNYGLALSKRNRLAVSWLIQDSGERQDVARLLGLYDLALRYGSNTAGLLSANLANALSNPAAIEPLEKLLRSDPPWAGRLWARVLQSPPSLVNAAKLRARLIGADLETPGFEDAGLITALVEANQLNAAFTLHFELSNSKSASGQFVSNSDFTAANRYPPLDWQTIQEGTFGSSIDPGSGKLFLNANGRASGAFVRQIIRLPAGKLRIAMAAATREEEQLPVILRLSCAEPDTSIAPLLFDYSNSDQFTINNNRNCRYFWLEIISRDVGRNNFNIEIDRVSIEALPS